MFWKALLLLIFPARDPIIPFYLKGFLEVEEATPNIGFSIPFFLPLLESPRCLSPNKSM